MQALVASGILRAFRKLTSMGSAKRIMTVNTPVFPCTTSIKSAVPPFRKKPDSLRLLCSLMLVTAGANMVHAQDGEVEEIIVQDTRGGAYRFDQSTVGKFTEPLLDTPQSVTTISSQLMEDRNVMSLDDALRNVPGITLGAGEFSWQGNNPNIRGFSSRNDMFLDGMRDLGSYARDPFNLEAVEVLLGPSSMVFGRGSTGGVINQSTKKPTDQEIRSLHVNLGNASTARATVDFNQPLALGNGGGFRLNLLAHQSDVPGRDTVETERYGIAPSLSVGLGNATNLTLSYMHLTSDSLPDYGMPWIDTQPADVRRDNFYGFDNDNLETDADVASAIVTHQINRDWSLNAQLRVADYGRESFITEPQVAPGVTRNDPPENVTVERMIFTGQSSETMQQGQLNVRGDFTTGNIDHSLMAGFESTQEESDPSFGFAAQTAYFEYGIPVPTTNLANPGGGSYTGLTADRLLSDATSDTLAAYVLDTLKFGDKWQLSLGLRWDRFETDYAERRLDVDGTQTSSSRFATNDTETSYRTALVYKPVPNGTLYLGWGTSFNPSAESVSFINSGRGLTVGDVALEPEENESLEFGVKWSLLNDRLLVDGAIFNITKDNARVPDPLNPGFNTLAGEQDITGFSVNMSGGFGDILHFTTGFTHLDDEQRNTLTGTTGRINNVAANTFSFWLNWTWGNRLDFGVGSRFMDERVVNNSKTADDYWAFDAMMKYQYSETIVYKLNLTNLTDEYYFDQLHPWHVVPGPGFGAVFAVNFDY